jgi:hypothetical protein
MNIAEEWRVIPSYPGYLASSHGRIMGPRAILKPHLDRLGYLTVTVWHDAGRSTRKVNWLICEAFHGPMLPGHQTAHWDGDSTNNIPANLRWATAQENAEDRARHGRTRALEKHHNAKLTLRAVKEIRALYASKEPGKYIKRGTKAALAKKYGVSIAVIGDVACHRRDCWKIKASPNDRF